MSNDNKTTSFNENYQKLKEIAEALRNQSEPDIDALIPMIETASAAYKNCRDRLEAVKNALKEHLPNSVLEEPLEK